MEGSETNSRSSSDSLRFLSPLELSGNSLVQVKAQLMTVDETTGLWKLVKGNPFSIVSVSRDEDSSQYYITAHRLTDQQKLLTYHLQPNTNYQRADATFHHWRSAADNQRHGLTFPTLGDARKFERIVRKAIQDISPTRDIQTEEEIFVNAETLRINCDGESAVPLRPHKPRRLTEEYRAASADERQQEHSSSSDQDSPTGATRKEETTRFFIEKKDSPSSSQERIITPSHIQAVNDSRKVIKSENVEPVLPPRTQPQKTSLKPPNSILKNRYTDYRNDCYSKQAQSEGSHKAQPEGLRDAQPEGLNKAQPECLHKAQPAKSIKNTPPLPRRKKRHRQNGLCCFRSSSSSEDYS